MIRRSPAELYIKYLLLHPDNYDLRAVRDIVRGQQLDYPGDDYVKGLRERLRPPSPFHPTNKLHRNSFKFLLKEQISGLFHPDESCLLARRILDAPRAKEAIETMAIIGNSHKQIAAVVRRLGNPCTPLAVDRYCQFYWNTKIVSNTELRALLRIRVEHLAYPQDGQDVTPDRRLQHAALTKEQYKDPRRVALDTPMAGFADLMNQIQMGILPSKLDLARLLRFNNAIALGRSMSAGLIGGPKAAADMRDYMLAAKLSKELMDDAVDPDAELQKQIHTLTVRTEAEEVQHLSLLSEGQHTVDMEPNPQSKEEANVDTKR